VQADEQMMVVMRDRMCSTQPPRRHRLPSPSRTPWIAHGHITFTDIPINCRLIIA
jgi:hypothetical protein